MKWTDRTDTRASIGRILLALLVGAGVALACVLPAGAAGPAPVLPPCTAQQRAAWPLVASETIAEGVTRQIRQSAAGRRCAELVTAGAPYAPPARRSGVPHR